MINRILLVAFVLGVLQWSSSVPVRAQTSCTTFVYCGAQSLWNASCVPALPGAVFNCISGAGGFTLACQVWNPQCAPAAAPKENHSGCLPGPSGSSNGGNNSSNRSTSPSCGSPISLTTGNTYIEETDVRLPGLSSGLTLVRTWNSM